MKEIKILLIISLILFVSCAPKDDQTNKNRQLVRNWLELYNQGKDKEASDYYADSIILHPAISPNKPTIGRDALFEGSLEVRKAEPNYKCVVKEIIAEGDRVVMIWDTILSNGTLEVVGIFRIKDGKIVELTEYYTGDGYRLMGGSEFY